ncbi:Cysteine-rich RLK (receptor-like protein kinase) 8 [Cucumis melo var. makuwa]|uniref:Cysteine-rich RLK (Receptor-like protein kinase) 8 n=1 Tax=Cucumis melo var. makuwa TaxID=1194695 RepID=A0A5D3CAL7_CUCMM|nr:Cysteine-rich RLK (receptor-like protein kinase) 8 [Cucumis melo var. makuwa]TYK08575.1 Cysteine-rich RLK (receptor-like protein kinase) 8 [Cucumis melo var. makuwa]
MGKLIYLSHIRPDISYAVSTVGPFTQAPYEEHMEAVNRIMRYLKTTLVIDKKSTSRYCTFAWGNLVTWRSKKQSVVAKSSAEVNAKY